MKRSRKTALVLMGSAPLLLVACAQQPEVQTSEGLFTSVEACASTGGVFDNYATVQGVDQFIPVDVYVPGCPPRPEMLIEGVMAIQRHVDNEGIPPMQGGKRMPLNIALAPTHQVAPQPVGLTVGVS